MHYTSVALPAPIRTDSRPLHRRRASAARSSLRRDQHRTLYEPPAGPPPTPYSSCRSWCGSWWASPSVTSCTIRRLRYGMVVPGGRPGRGCDPECTTWLVTLRSVAAAIIPTAKATFLLPQTNPAQLRAIFRFMILSFSCLHLRIIPLSPNPCIGPIRTGNRHNPPCLVAPPPGSLQCVRALREGCAATGGAGTFNRFLRDLAGWWVTGRRAGRAGLGRGGGRVGW